MSFPVFGHLLNKKHRHDMGPKYDDNKKQQMTIDNDW